MVGLLGFYPYNSSFPNSNYRAKLDTVMHFCFITYRVSIPTHTPEFEMAIVSRMVSDITGAEANEEAFVVLTVREHPAITEPKALDVLPAEIESLKDAGDIVVLEVSNGEKKQLVVKLADFRKLVSDELVVKARGTRGRRPGFSPGPK